MANLPEDIRESLNKLELANDSENHHQKIHLFMDGIESLNGCFDDHPQYINLLKNYKKSYTREFLTSLKNTKPNIAEYDWQGYAIIFYGYCKEEINQLLNENQDLHLYFKDYFGL